MTAAVLKTPLLWLAGTCGICGFILMAFGDFEGALLGAISGAALYFAHERLRITELPPS
jgi:hypothetical protein